MPPRTGIVEGYFRPRGFEVDGRIYRWLGVAHFGRLLRRLVQPDPRRRVTNGYTLGGRGLGEVRAYERIARRNEIIHLLGVVLAVVFLAAGRGLLVAGIIVLAANLPCFLLQRYNRARVHRLLRRRS